MAKRIGGGTAAPTRATIFAVGAALAVITWLVFGQVLGHQFVNYDDEFYIYENPRVMSGLSWQNVWWTFTHTVCFNWHPLTVISHMFAIISQVCFFIASRSFCCSWRCGK